MTMGPETSTSPCWARSVNGKKHHGVKLLALGVLPTAASRSWSSYTNQSQTPDLAFPTIQCLPRSLLPLAWGRGAPFPHCSPLGVVGTAHSNPSTVGSSTSHTARGRVWTKAGTTSLTVLQGAPGMQPGILLQGDAGLWPGCNRNQEAASSPFSHCPSDLRLLPQALLP